ncbi:type 2 lanthipeptide synthetase LanM family protein [Actinophytocola sp. NPDC049390]|uniref:type 2 lanthipeptide synthetase LanM family protein n=1 Tax=Actinophytocola sp. NPDC049390 TaxID=3363894 RepID=UPI0037A7EF59
MDSTAAGIASAAGLAPGWWTNALALHERFTPAPSRTPHANADPFELRLADLGLDPADVANAAAAVGGLAPAWADIVDEVVLGADHTENRRVDGDWEVAFGQVFAPFVAFAAERITAAFTAGGPSESVDLDAFVAAVSRTLTDRLVATGTRTLVTELRLHADRGALVGRDPVSRFHDFVAQMSTGTARARLFTRYPVLARLLAQMTDAAVTAAVELLDRFRQDRHDVVTTLFPDGDPGVLVGADFGLGDPHRGRSVATLAFSGGARLVYKPRDVTLQRHLAGMVAWLNDHVEGLGLRAVPTLVREGYGWSAYVEAAPLTDVALADRFYFRQGALLALLHAVRATDMHYANVIAAGDTPVVVDVETLFHPALTADQGGDPAAAALADSVYRTALLPLIAVGDHGTWDLSGLGGDADRSPVSRVSWQDAGTDRMRLVRVAAEARTASNRPRAGTEALEPRAHQAALCDGFRTAHDRIAAHKSAFAELVRACENVLTRVVFRPTWIYTSMLDESTHPDLLADGLSRDRALAMLCSATATGPLRRLAAHEIADLWAGDVPMFTMTAGRAVVCDSAGDPTGVRLPTPGLHQALDALDAMDDTTRRDQEWVVAATLATRSQATAHVADHVAEPLPAGAPADPDALIAAACTMGDRLVASAHRGRERVNWLGVELVEERQWLVLPLGAGLATGYLGVALFLAQLGAATGIARYTEHAALAVRALPTALGHIASRPALVDAVGCGGLTGLGGIAYGAARVGALLDDAGLRDAAEFAVGLAGEVAGRTTDPTWTAGHAGCLAAMTAVHTDLGFSAAADVANDCAELLGAFFAGRDGPGAGLPGGFARGRAGIGWALANHGSPAHADLGRHVASTATADAARGGWCSGPAGALLAVASAGIGADTPWPEPDPDVGRPGDLSLCHGELGVVEVLGALGRQGPVPDDIAVGLRRRVSRVLATVQHDEPWCGVPDRLATPGLLNGLSGIGYALLRLAAPDTTPSVLLLEPADPPRFPVSPARTERNRG